MIPSDRSQDFDVGSIACDHRTERVHGAMSGLIHRVRCVEITIDPHRISFDEISRQISWLQSVVGMKSAR